MYELRVISGGSSTTGPLRGVFSDDTEAINAAALLLSDPTSGYAGLYRESGRATLHHVGTEVRFVTDSFPEVSDPRLAVCSRCGRTSDDYPEHLITFRTYCGPGSDWARARPALPYDYFYCGCDGWN
jgi:hypothetical protein